MTDTTVSLRRKIDSAGDLQSVVRTMKALSASSIGQYEKSVRALTDYYRAVELGLSACLRKASTPASEIPEQGADSNDIKAVVFGSDQGLVGQFNDVVVDYAVRTLNDLHGTPMVWAVGARVHARLTDVGVPVIGVLGVPNSVKAITSLVARIQMDTEAHRPQSNRTSLYVFHNRPTSGTLYEPIGQRLLPLDSQWQRALIDVAWPTKNLPEVMCSDDITLRALLREYLFISLYRACAESLASENTSRLAAMERADRNIKDLLETLLGTLHRVRQSSIDEELFDVVAGAESTRDAGPA